MNEKNYTLTLTGANWGKELAAAPFSPRARSLLFMVLLAWTRNKGVAGYPQTDQPKFDEILRVGVDTIIIDGKKLALEIRTHGNNRHLWLRVKKKKEY